MRLLLTAGAVQGVGIFYDGSFLPIGMTQFFSIMVGVFLIVWTMRLPDVKKSMNISENIPSNAAAS
jgi:hypothetical protein